MNSGTVQNILRVYFLATAEEIQSGLTWYSTQLGIAQRLARQTVRKYRNGLPTDKVTVAGLLAAFSPRKQWSGTLDLLCEWYASGGTVAYLTTQVEKARLISSGQHPLTVLKGPKERAFFQCFLGSNALEERVTIDGHAFSIWCGEHIFTTKARVTATLYRLAEEDYREAADMVGIKPSQLQAITWLAWRRLHNSKGHVTDKNRSL